MRGKKAKKIRKAVYRGKDFREREYLTTEEGRVTSDFHRRVYQQTKRIVK